MESDPIEKGFDGCVHADLVVNGDSNVSLAVTGTTPYVTIERQPVNFTPTFNTGSVVLSNQHASYYDFDINSGGKVVTFKLDALYVSNSGATFPLTITTSPLLPLPATAQPIAMFWGSPASSRVIYGTVQTNGSLYFPAANSATFITPDQYWTISATYVTV